MKIPGYLEKLAENIVFTAYDKSFTITLDEDYLLHGICGLEFKSAFRHRTSATYNTEKFIVRNLKT